MLNMLTCLRLGSTLPPPKITFMSYVAKLRVEPFLFGSLLNSQGSFLRKLEVFFEDSFVVNSKVVVPRPGDSFCILFESGFGRFEA